MLTYRARTRVPAEELEQKVGKLLTDEDYNILITRRTKILKPDGSPLCVYLPGAVKPEMDAAYPILTTIRATTDNRGAASGSRRADQVREGQVVRSRAKGVMSSILGSFEAAGHYKYCRLTAWTATELNERWPALLPLLQATGSRFAEYVPDRYDAQMTRVRKTYPEWIIGDTPFTTLTVNNTYPTGVHKDKGDLDEGFSCLAVARRGNYTGGRLTFPEYRAAVDLQDGDLILMNAHDWHGNTTMTCECGNVLDHGPCPTCAAERISVVAYYRSKMAACGSAPEENAKAVDRADQYFGLGGA